MAAIPETLRVVQVIHDSTRIAVHDTVVRLAEAHASDRWIGIGADLATVIAACVAVWGIKAWRDQLRGTTEYRLAVRVYRAILRLRDRITETRAEKNHMIWLRPEDAAKEDIVLKLRYEKYSQWFKEVVRASLALDGLGPEVELHWGTDGKRHINMLIEMAQRLRGGHEAYFKHELEAQAGDRAMAEAAKQDKRTAFEPIIGHDKYGEELRRRVTAAEVYLRPMLGKPRRATRRRSVPKSSEEKGGATRPGTD